MKKIINTPLAPTPVGPYNQAVLVGNLLFVSGQIAIEPTSGKLCFEDITSETKQVLENIKAILTEANTGIENIVKASIFLINMDDFVKVNEIYSEYFNEATAPARETVAVQALPKGAHIEISVIASVSQ